MAFCGGVNAGKLHDLIVDERTVLDAIKGVLALIDFKASLGGRGKKLGEALSHHVVVLSHACLKTCTSCLAEGLATELEVLFCNLPVVLDDVDHDVGLVWELGDVLSAGVPPHDVAAVLKSLDKSNGMGKSLQRKDHMVNITEAEWRLQRRGRRKGSCVAARGETIASVIVE